MAGGEYHGIAAAMPCRLEFPIAFYRLSVKAGGAKQKDF
jgi:hypothetical protein